MIEIKEELFAILIAIIFIYESLGKLLDIRKKYPFSADPFQYQHDFNDNNTECFRCLHVNESISLVDSIYTEKQVNVIIKARCCVDSNNC